jgi:predicted short-subunit dehydrogenase-like oxidoreductase (DUF2520 family)
MSPDIPAGESPRPGFSEGRPWRPTGTIAIVGRGRMGQALARRFSAAGYHVAGPLGRRYAEQDLQDAGVVLLCVPDAEIGAAALALAARLPGDDETLVGHCSGASGLDAVRDAVNGRRGAFSLHPLMTVSGRAAEESWAGAAAATDGSDTRALDAARELARALGLRPLVLAEHDRAAYHAAACIASNFLVTLETFAERLGRSAGIEREQLVPLVRRTVENWARAGESALTGPIARGDEDTERRQRIAVAERSPDLLELFDALARATHALADPDRSRASEPVMPALTQVPA